MEPNSEFSISGQQPRKKGGSGRIEVKANGTERRYVLYDIRITDETRKYYSEYDETTMRQLQIVDENCVNLDLIEQLVTHTPKITRRCHSSLPPSGWAKLNLTSPSFAV